LAGTKVVNAEETETEQFSTQEMARIERDELQQQLERRTTWQIIRSLPVRVWIVCIINGLLGFGYNGFAEIFPLWAKAAADPQSWGLGMQAFQIGISHAIAGPCGATYQFFFYRRVVQRVGGVVNMMRLKASILVVVIATFPLQHLTVNYGGWFWLFVIVWQAVKSVGFGGCFASMYVLVNETASNVGGSTAGVVNGLGQAFENIGRSISPAAVGGLYYLSNTLPFPWNPFLTFWMLSSVMLSIAVMVGFGRVPAVPVVPKKDHVLSSPLDVREADSADRFRTALD